MPHPVAVPSQINSEQGKNLRQLRYGMGGREAADQPLVPLKLPPKVKGKVKGGRGKGWPFCTSTFTPGEPYGSFLPAIPDVVLKASLLHTWTTSSHPRRSRQIFDAREIDAESCRRSLVPVITRLSRSPTNVCAPPLRALEYVQHQQAAYVPHAVLTHAHEGGCVSASDLCDDVKWWNMFGI
ncbi:hypothetical protein B0H19DRAFT_1238440 [Mycena capillaripes]|nr:hypothetical protein B0H19DRAFT_1238440 [Mycena capillaripes]